jgi:hypothetical protein
LHKIARLLFNFHMKPRCNFRAAAPSILIFFALNFSARAADGPLAWPQIMPQARPWAWWWWHGSAVDTTNIAHELQRFHDAGLGGVQITSIYGTKGAEARDIPYLTPRWLSMMGDTVDEAKSLNMGVTMTLGSGWCFGGPTVSDQDANANVVVKTFEVAAGGKLNGKFNRASTQALVAFSPDGKSVELTDKISADGSVDWSAPTDSINSWTVYAVSQKPSGQKVKRAAPGGEGWMLNPAYPQAMTDWLKWFDSALADYHGSKPMAVFQDSYEYRTDWSPDFFAQFEKRRGYKLQNELPALFGDTQDDHAARVKYDYRRTLSEIMAEQSEPAWIDWAHKNEFSTIYQAHGTPGNWLDLYADADMPETEMFHNDRSILISKFASSAAHVAGHQLTGAETGTWLKEHFTETLADVKYLADDMFLAGVNRIFYHGTCYSPDDAPWPGWLFYASTEMNPRNPIWHDVPTLNNYIARVQSVLQSGKPDNDILLYWPVADFWSNPAGRVQPMGVSTGGWFEGQNIAKTAHELWDRGYAFDYVSDAQLQTAKVVDGKIQMPGGDYKVIVVPECKYIPLETFKQLLTLAESGATVIFEGKLPDDVSGLKDLQLQRAELINLKSKLVAIWNGDRNPGYDGYHIGKGNIYAAMFFPGTKSLDYENEVACEPLAGFGLSFIRRSFNGGWNYFIANRTTTNFDGWVNFDRPAESFMILEPLTAGAGLAATRETSRRVSLAKQRFVSAMDVHLQLVAGASVILRALDHPLNESDSYPRWNYFQTDGPPVEISGPWNVKFITGGPTLPADSQITKLASWTVFADTNAQAFAGTAKYETTFDAPERGLSQAAARPTATDALRVETTRAPYQLDLGDVRQSARVKLNGKDYGTLITPPFRVVVDNLKPTGNTLEVEVTSVAANRIRDLDRRGVNWKIFKDINIVNVNYKPFDAADWPLTDCGLLGPVTLTAICH